MPHTLQPCALNKLSHPVTCTVVMVCSFVSHHILVEVPLCVLPAHQPQSAMGLTPAGNSAQTAVCLCWQAGFMLPLALPEGDACYDDKADIAELNGLQDSADFVLHPDQPPTNELMAFLRLVNISGDQL